MPMQTYEGAELIELLNKKQERTILGMFSWAKNLARTESGRSSEFLETMENLGLPKAHINEVRKLFGGSTSKGSDESNEIKMERRYANTTIVTSDLLRRAVAALRTGATLEDEQLVQMEKAAAIISRLAAQALQVASQKPVDKFCELFGVPNTEELHRLISDPSMMSVEKRAATQKALNELFELKRSMNEAMRSGQHLNLEPPLPVRAAVEEAEERNVLEHNALFLVRSAGTCGQGSLAVMPAIRGSSRKEEKTMQRKDTAKEEEKARARGPTGADERVMAGGLPSIFKGADAVHELWWCMGAVREGIGGELDDTSSVTCRGLRAAVICWVQRVEGFCAAMLKGPLRRLFGPHTVAPALVLQGGGPRHPTGTADGEGAGGVAAATPHADGVDSTSVGGNPGSHGVEDGEQAGGGRYLHGPEVLAKSDAAHLGGEVAGPGWGGLPAEKSGTAGTGTSEGKLAG